MAAVMSSNTIEAPRADLANNSVSHCISLPPPVDSTRPASFVDTIPARTNPPPPNPPFVFPAKQSQPSFSDRRPRSAAEPRGLTLQIANQSDNRPPGLPPLPAFSFNPGASIEPNTENTILPPQVPSRTRPISARQHGHGHRRGGSEFVGGSIRGGDAIAVMGVSPTRSESGMASPTQPPARPRHSHKRSAASHDITQIMRGIHHPPAGLASRGSTAPSSPVGFGGYDFALAAKQLSQASPAADPVPSDTTPHANTTSDSTVPPDLLAVEPVKPANRARVGFSDKLEFIPRPLSLVSSESSSIMTAYRGHSLSDSISSVLSGGKLESPEHTRTSISLSAPEQPTMAESRPSTAGAVLERASGSLHIDTREPGPRRRNSTPYITAVRPSPPILDTKPSASPTKSSKKWSFFGLDPFTSIGGSPVKSRPLSTSSSESEPKTVISASLAESVEQPTTSEPKLKPVIRKRSKQRKRVKTWAGLILSRKSQFRHHKHKRRAPTPSLRIFDASSEKASIVTPNPDISALPPTITVNQKLKDNYYPSTAPSTADDEGSYPIIDLDAALGPFNTPLPRNPEWEAAQRAGGFVKKQLHSAVGMRGFSGPDMHYHRRAESAPEISLFESRRFLRPFGSSSTMADVFEEDEEEEEEKRKTEAPSGPPTPLAKVASPQATDTALVLRKGLSTCEDTSETTADSEACAQLHHRNRSEVCDRDPTRLNALHQDTKRELRGAHEASVIDKDASSIVKLEHPTDMAPLSPRQAVLEKDAVLFEVNPVISPPASLRASSPYTATHSPALPSPSSPLSYDAQRISTAPSSVADDNFQSLLLGEPGPEVRISVDDTPSLNSGRSVATRDSCVPRPPTLQNSNSRPSSLATSIGRRSLLANIFDGRLSHSSHGEKSKLSLEVDRPSPHDVTPKSSKKKRLTRLMRFWKPKDANPS